MPWSLGCVSDVLRGKKNQTNGFQIRNGWMRWTFINSTFLLSKENFRLTLCKNCSKISDVIQAFLLALYSTGKLSVLWKHMGFWYFPIANSGSFSEPSILAPTKKVIRNLLCLPLSHLSSWSLQTKVLSGRTSQKEGRLVNRKNVLAFVIFQYLRQHFFKPFLGLNWY